MEVAVDIEDIAHVGGPYSGVFYQVKSHCIQPFTHIFSIFFIYGWGG